MAATLTNKFVIEEAAKKRVVPNTNSEILYT